MPLAHTELEILQARKLIQCVREQDAVQVEKIADLGMPGVLDFQGQSLTLLHPRFSY